MNYIYVLKKINNSYEKKNNIMLHNKIIRKKKENENIFLQ